MKPYSVTYLSEKRVNRFSGREYYCPLRHDEVKRLLGVPEKMPKQFSLPPTEVTGVEVYITESPKLLPRFSRNLWGGKPKSSKHRVMAICPCCGTHVSFGRFHQHVKVHS